MAKTENTQSFGLLALALARISFGLIFLWAFFDKLLGLGFATCRSAQTGAVDVLCSRAWLEGGSPTAGFLNNAVKGPFEGFYQSLAGNGFIDWLFMAGLLLIGTALLLGIGVRVAALSGSLMLLMMWSAALPPANNPAIDEHIVYIFLLLAVLGFNSRQRLGLGRWWAKQSIVQRFPFLA